MEAPMRRYVITAAPGDSRNASDLETALREAGVTIDPDYSVDVSEEGPTFRGTASDEAAQQARVRGFRLFPDLPFGAF
jgi:hypothetical protein